MASRTFVSLLALATLSMALLPLAHGADRMLQSTRALQKADAWPPVPIYGKWCGPNYGSGDPINDLDTCCQTHDNCYAAKGYFNCNCDLDLTKCAYYTSASWWQVDKRSARKAIQLYMVRQAAVNGCLNAAVDMARKLDLALYPLPTP